MKKIFTLVVASLFTMAVFAADRRPSVTVQASKNYQIVIDGKSYSSGYGNSMTIANLWDGYHTVSVYDAGRGFFFRRGGPRMISSASFMLRGNDISICIDQFGRIQVTESRMGKDRDDRGWDKNDRNKGFDQGNDKGFNQGYGKDKNDHGSNGHDKHF